MRRFLFFTLVLISFNAVAINDIVSENEKEVVFNPGAYQVDADFKKAAMHALISHDWEILTATGKIVTGKLRYGDVSPVAIDYRNPKAISIRYTKYNEDSPLRYLRNLKHFMLDGLLSCALQKN